MMPDLMWEQWVGLWMLGSLAVVAIFHGLSDPRGNDD